MKFEKQYIKTFSPETYEFCKKVTEWGGYYCVIPIDIIRKREYPEIININQRYFYPIYNSYLICETVRQIGRGKYESDKREFRIDRNSNIDYTIKEL